MNFIGNQGISTPFLFLTGWILFALAAIWLAYGKWRSSLRSRQASVELQEMKALFDALMRQTSDAVAVLDTQGKVERVNQASVKLFGYTQELLAGKPLPHASEEETAAFRRTFEQALEGRPCCECETKRLHLDGMAVPVSVSIIPVRNSAMQVVRVLSCSRDMTERKRIEQELEASQANYRFITENMSDMIYVLKKDGTVVYASASHTKLIGYEIQELIGMDPSERIGLIHPDDQGMVTRLFGRDGGMETETTMVYRLRHRDGHWVSVESRYKPIRDETGGVVSMLIVSRDVSEVIETKELLRQSDKLSMIGQLAAGIAHEIATRLPPCAGLFSCCKPRRQTSAIVKSCCPNWIGSILSSASCWFWPSRRK